MFKSSMIRKRVISMLLVCFMVIGMVPVTARAAEAEPTEPGVDANGVYQIGTYGELLWFAGLVNGTLDGVAKNAAASADLTADIVANENVLAEDGSLNAGEYMVWTPIGTSTNAYYIGNFDGQGHSISGLYLNDSTMQYVGLFGAIKENTVQNVTILDSYFNGKLAVAAVAGMANKATVTNCGSAATVECGDTATYIGGVVGRAMTASVMSGCWNTGKVTGKAANFGGVIGSAAGVTLTNSWNSGNAGGLVGAPGNSMDVQNCHTVVGTLYSGKLKGKITNSYYLDDAADGSDAAAKTAEQFASGEVAYLLNGQNSENVTWFQKLGEDAYPTLTGDAIVYFDGTGYNNGAAEEPEQPETIDPGFGISVNGTPCDIYADGTYDMSAYGMGEIPAIKVTVPAGTTAVTFTRDADWGLEIFNIETMARYNGMVFDVPVAENGCGYLAVINSQEYYYVKIDVAAAEVPEQPEEKIVNVVVGSAEMKAGETKNLPVGINTEVTDNVKSIKFTVTADEGVTVGYMFMGADASAAGYSIKGSPANGTITVQPMAGTGALPASVNELVKVKVTLPANASGEYMVYCKAEIEWETEPENVKVVYTDGKITGPAAEVPEEPDLPALYNIEIASGIENGTVTVSANQAEAGTEITVTATPAAGYVLDKVTVTDAEGNEIAVEGGKFTMPASNVTVSATFKAEPEYIKFKISDVAEPVLPGDEIVFPVIVENNLAKNIKDISVGLSAPSCLTLKEIRTGKDMPEGKSATLSMGIRLKLANGFKLPNGEVALLVYTVNENAQPGNYSVSLNLGDWSAYYSDWSKFTGEKTVEPGSFTVAEKPEYMSFAVSDAGTALPGEDVTFAVTVDHNVKVDMKNIDLTVNVPENLTFKAVANGAAMPEGKTAAFDAETKKLSLGTDFTLPKGEVALLTFTVNAEAAAGQFELTLGDTVSAAYGDGTAYAGNFFTEGGTYFVPNKLAAPVLTAENIAVTESSITVKDVAAVDGAVLYYAISEDGTSYGAWQTKSTFANLKEQTRYFIKAYYKSSDTTKNLDSDEAVLEVTTEAAVVANIKLTVGNVVAGRGDTVRIPVYIEHDMGEQVINLLQTYFHVGEPNDESAISIDNVERGSALITDKNSWGFMGPQWDPIKKDFRYNQFDLEYVQFGQGEAYILIANVAENAPDQVYTIIPDVAYSDSDTIDVFNWTFVNGTVTLKTPMTAPVLTDAVAGENHITVTPPATVDGVKVEYAISADGGETWSAWQESNTFENLEAETNYLVVAHYVPEKGSSYDPSWASEPLAVRTVWPTIKVVCTNAVAEGETVDIAVSLEHTAEKTATSITFVPKLSEGVTIKSVAAEGFTVTVLDGEITLFKDEAFAIPEGNVLTMTLNVPAEAGDYTVSFEEVVFYNDTTIMGLHVEIIESTVHIHEIVEIPAVAATCYADGLTAGEKCALCGEILVVQEVVPATGHTMTSTVVAPEHEKMGYTFHECEGCDYSFVSDWTEALGHEYEQSVAKEATCTADGEWTFTCSCGKSYTQVMPKTGHSCDAVVTDPTCTEIGYTTHTCAKCDFSYITDIVAALGHTESEAVTENEVAATCTKDGSYDSVVYCSVCNEELSRETVTVPAVGHTEEILPAVAATCTEDGLTEGKKCSVCGEILAAQEVIPATGHAWKGTGCENCDAKRENPFTDVPEDSWFIDPVLWAVDEGITNGATETTFNPTGDLLRAQVVTMLWRHAGEPVVEVENPFTDVNEGDWYYDAVLWAVSEGITAGTSATTFDPAGKTTRAQAITFLWRYLDEPEANGENPFVDVNTGDWYGKAVLWAVANGITEGMSETQFGVGVYCNRAHMVTFLYRALN